MNATTTPLKTPKTPEIAITPLPNGQSVVVIAGTTYLATPTRSGFSFQKEAKRGGECYEVVCGGGKAHTCTCPARGWGYGTCRHLTAANQLLAAF